MNEKEIEEGGRAIEEFIGGGYWQIWRIGGYKPYWSNKYISKEEAQTIIDTSDNGKGVMWLVGYAEPKYIINDYHTNWDLLMPVIQKINKEHDCLISINMWTKNNADATEVKIYPILLGSSEIESEEKEPIVAAWKAVVEYIKWYNQQKATGNIS